MPPGHYLLLQHRGQLGSGQSVASILRGQVQGGDGHLFLLPERGGLHLMPPLLDLHVHVLGPEVSGHGRPRAPVNLHAQGRVVDAGPVSRVHRPKALAPFLPPPRTLPLQLAGLRLGPCGGRPRGAGSLLGQGLLDGSELGPVEGLGAALPPALTGPAPLLLGVWLPGLPVLLLPQPRLRGGAAPVFALRQRAGAGETVGQAGLPATGPSSLLSPHAFFYAAVAPTRKGETLP